MKSTIRQAAALALMLVARSPENAQSQTSGFLNGIGYGFAGGAFGLAATANATCQGSDFICIPGEMVVATLGGGLLGIILGSTVSSRANRTVAEGRPLGGGHLAAVTVGTVLGGATLGLIVGGVLTNPDGEGTIFGSDQQTLTIMALAGGTLGFLGLRRNWNRLTGVGGRPLLLEAEPLALVHGRPGLVLHARF